MQPKPPRHLLVGLDQATHVAAEAVLVELVLRLDVPQPAAIGRDLVGQHDAHLLVLPQAPELHLEVDETDADAEEQADEEVVDADEVVGVAGERRAEHGRDADRVLVEVRRDVVKQLGIDLSGHLNYGTAVVNFNTSNPFSATGQPISDTFLRGAFPSVTATLRAMERAGVIRTLAEPNLTAISGETATFVAGGEFPIPNGLSCDTTRSPPICQPQITFKKFGVSLVFTPVVLSEGRISLKVMTEVSDLSTENAMTLQVTGSASSLTVPSIQTRRADTVVEIPSGGSLAMAGMIQEQTKQAISGLPALQQVPVLGSLFRSRDYVNHQSELMVLVTPYVVRAVAQKQLSKPDDGFADPSDPQSVLLGNLNRIYGVAGKSDTLRGNNYHGKYGFILD